MPIYRATVADLEQLVPLYEQYRSFYDLANDTKAVADFLGTRLRNQDTTLFVSRDTKSGAIMGFVQLFHSFSIYELSAYFILNDVFVVPAFRKQGVGSALLEVAKQHCLDAGGRGLLLETGIENYNAQSLYLKAGFKPMADVVFMGWEADKAIDYNKVG